MTGGACVATSLARLDAWLESMRSEEGYCGPVVHWWQSCLQYSGPMHDWRYEGIITGYLEMYRATGARLWLDRARQAGDDLCNHQLPGGTFLNSSFEVGPIEGGTPHEAAADIGLLELARVLRADGDDAWRRYFSCAETNIREYQIGRLWDGDAFLDQPWNRTRVANKNATTMEALLLYEELSGEPMEEYVTGAAELILSAQVYDDTPFKGATIHLGSGAHRLAIGIYTARCAAALLRLYERYPDERYRTAAIAMGAFLERLVRPCGTVFGYYPDGRTIVNPTWISPSGDVLRALLALREHTPVSAGCISMLTSALLAHQQPAGGIATAIGLGRKGGVHEYTGVPDFRDVIPVAGWVDKAFRALAMLLPEGSAMPDATASSDGRGIPCKWKGKACIFRETSDGMRLDQADSRHTLYLWEKGSHYPLVYEL